MFFFSVYYHMHLSERNEIISFHLRELKFIYWHVVITRKWIRNCVLVHTFPGIKVYDYISGVRHSYVYLLRLVYNKSGQKKNMIENMQNHSVSLCGRQVLFWSHFLAHSTVCATYITASLQQQLQWEEEEEKYRHHSIFSYQYFINFQNPYILFAYA